MIDMIMDGEEELRQEYVNMVIQMLQHLTRKIYSKGPCEGKNFVSLCRPS